MRRLRLHRVALLYFWLLLGSACTMIPEYSRPELPVSNAWTDLPAGARPKTAGEQAFDIQWKSFFQSQPLQYVLATALANNRDLRVATLRIEEARSLYRIERADLLPGIDIQGRGSRQKYPEAVSSGSGIGVQTDLYSANLVSSAFELDLFGKLRSQNEAAFESYLATEEAQRAVQISLIAETANTYLQWLADRKILSLAEQTLRAQTESFKLIERSYTSGVSSRLDLVQVRRAVETARVERMRFLRIVEQDKNALIVLMGTKAEDSFPEDTTLDDVELLESLPVGIPSEVLLSRPDILALEHSLLAANAQIGAARAAFFPSISLTGSYGYASSDLSELFTKGAEGAWTFIPQITLPLFKGGENLARLNLARVRKNIAITRYESGIQTAFREVADELAALRTLDGELEALQRLVEATQESYDLSLSRYRLGVDSFLAVLDAQRFLFAAQRQEIEVERLRLANLVNLYKVLGGGVAG